jgi:branched-chain amino acid transport system substrate-binding protein
VPIRILPVLLLAGFLGLGLAVPPPTSVGDAGVIKVVSSLPRSGSAKGQTDAIVKGIRLAFVQAGYKVTAGGREYRIEYRDLDDATAAAGQWTAEQEIANANLARLDPDVMVYIGTYNSGAAKVSMPILNKSRVLMLSPANTSPELTKPGTGNRSEPGCYRPTGTVNFFRVIPTDDLQGKIGAAWAHALGVRRVYILDDNEMYGKGIANRFADHCRLIGVEVLGQESIDAKAQEFTPLLTKVRLTNPDLVYFGGTTESRAGQVAKDMVKVGLRDCKMMGPDGTFTGRMIASAGGDVLEGRFYCTFGGLPAERLTGKGRAFVEQYQKEFGSFPSEAYAVYGYECGQVALDVIRRAGAKDREALIRACAAIGKDNPFDGATGRWSFDENGDTTSTMMSGQFVTRTEKGYDFAFARTLELDKDGKYLTPAR